MTDVLTREPFGPALRAWRTRRSRSQLALASEAGVSQRHISFLETGRSNPSREMVIHLGVVLDVPLRDRNAMLVAAGYAPVYAERAIDDPDLADIRHALETMLRAHEPFPAYVIDRHWNLTLANEAAGRLIGLLPAPAQAQAANLLRLTLHPDGLRLASPNWEEAAAAVLRRVQRDLADNPSDTGLAELVDEVSRYPGVPDARRLAQVPTAHDLLVPLSLQHGGDRLSFFTTIATLVGPVDITLEELRLETLLPADPATEQALRTLAA